MLTHLLLSALFLLALGGVCVCVSDVAVAVEGEVAADTTAPALLMRRIGLRLLWPCNTTLRQLQGPRHRSPIQ